MKNRKGQALFEILVAVAVVGIILGSSIIAITVSLRANAQSKAVRSASLYLQEMMDNARSVAEGDWHTLYNSIDRNSPAYVTVNGSSLIFVNGTEGVIENNITTGLIGYWKLDESAGTTVYDSSRLGDNGTLTNGPTQAGTASCKVGGCLNFDGTDDYVLVSHNTNLNLANKLTMSFFVKGANENHVGGYWGAMTKGSYQSSGWDLFLQNGSTTAKKSLSFRLNNSGLSPTTGYINCPETDVSTNYVHLAISIDMTASPQGTCYVNGMATGTGNFPAGYTTVNNGTQNLKIGNESSRYIKGLMDEVRIYNRALSAAEVYQLYNSRIYNRYLSIASVQRAALDGPIVTSGIDDPSTQKLTGYITWPGGITISAIEFLTRSTNRVQRITDWSDSSTYSSQNGLNLSTPGQASLP